MLETESIFESLYKYRFGSIFARFREKMAADSRPYQILGLIFSSISDGTATEVVLEPNLMPSTAALNAA